MGWLKSALCGVRWFLGFEEENKPKDAVAATPFVTEKPSQLYFDEDGDLANEFYVEVLSSKGRRKMKRITKNITWQGIIELEKPRLHVDFPVAIYHG